MENKLVTFGEAIAALKTGKTICRQVWNGTVLTMMPAYGDIEPYIGAKLWNGKIYSWVPTQEDLLTDDWLIE